jgi:tRNA (mo5U34)-methyltransferase
MSPDNKDLRARVDAIKWYHTIDFGNGVVSRGMDNSPDKLLRLKLPASFAGKAVLDIGAWDGFFSFEAERRGASRVLAADSFAWTGGVDGVSKAGFELAHAHFGSRVESRTLDVLDLAPDKVGTFDVVFFLGVLYHMRHPLLALERVASVAKELLVLETLVDMLNVSRPAMAFYPGAELSRDPTNWIGPNPAAVEGMLRTVGFTRFEYAMRPRSFPRRLVNAAQLKLRRGFDFLPQLRTDRIVIHAWK